MLLTLLGFSVLVVVGVATRREAQREGLDELKRAGRLGL
jgi:hypothetical protein